MAPVDLGGLSSNWKALQAKLKTEPSTTPSKQKTINGEQQHSLKRKRTEATNGKNKHDTTKALNGHHEASPQKIPRSRKRQKMDEPASVGASVKRNESKNVSRSISMPSLKSNTRTGPSKNAIQATSILEAHPDFPDVENEGVSELALPGKYVALDCEMVGVGPEPNRDSALARVSLVNYHGHQVYDSYVQVPRKIQVTDYRTAISGIEPKHLRSDVARPFDEVRNDLKILLGGRILVGHAVKNDLDVLILKHDKRFIRDTSKFSKFRALSMIPGRTPGLKLLVEKLLGVEIQVGAHSSVEDARATMALYRLDKDDFEQEIRQKYGHMRPRKDTQEAEVENGEEVQKKTRDRKKKKKRN